MLNGSFQEHIPYDCLVTFLWVPLGLLALYGGFLKNVVGRLQFAKDARLQAIGHSAYTAINAIKWVDYSSWLSQPEGVTRRYLEAYLENWLILSAVMIFMW